MIADWVWKVLAVVGRVTTEVQGISFVGSTSEVCHSHPLCNLQNLCPVPVPP